MKIYNLTASTLVIPVGVNRIQIDSLAVSPSIVSSPDLVTKHLPSLISLYGENILIVPNTMDYHFIQQEGNGLPAENVVDDETAVARLEEAKKSKASKSSKSAKSTKGK